jgi:diguanylate cyclase (GGDEF)-like protein
MGNETTDIQQDQAASSAADQAASSAAGRGSYAGLRVALACACVLLGIGASLLVASLLASESKREAERRFQFASAAIVSSLNGAIRHEQDLKVSASTFFAGNPHATPGQFAAWAGWARALAQFPELQRLSLLSAVKTSQLRSFAARTGVKVAKGASPARQIGIKSSDLRAEYCLTTAEVVRGAGFPAPRGIDYCARESRLLASRGSGRSIDRAYGARGILEVQTPVYRGLATPAGSDARNTQFVGWVREVINPAVLVRGALAGHPGYAASLRYGRSLADVVVLGARSSGAQSANARLDGGLTLTSLGPPAAVPLLAGGRAWVLLAGLLIGLLLSAIVLLFGRRKADQSSALIVPPTPEPAAVVEVEPLYDPLTALPNRPLTLDRASLVLARARRQSGLLAGVLLIDIDWFKDVNEKLGHEAGDQLLKIVAGRLQGVMRVEDTVGRLGADQFAVLIECTARSLRLDALAQRVLETLHQPIELDGFGPTFSMTASIGVAFGRYETADELLKDGETALAAAKAEGKARYKLFDANTHSVVESRSSLEADLSAAVEKQELSLGFEPIYELQSQAVIGFEATPCWSHPVEGEMAATELLELAQDCGLTVPIDRWSLEQACAQAAAWEVAGKAVSVSVKVGAEQLHREGLLTDVRRALQQSGVRPELLMLEVAESAVMSDVGAATQRLQEIKRLGVRLAIDDFGDSGYAYHSDLRRMPIDCLRVDRSSLAASDDPEYRNWLFEAILMVGRELSLAVVAKGVQSEQQLGELRALGCTAAQGACLSELMNAGVPAEPSSGVASAKEPPGAASAEASGPASAEASGAASGAASADPTGVAGQRASTSVEPVAGQRASTSVEPTGVAGQRASTSVEPTGVAGQRASTSVEPTGVAGQQASTSVEPTGVAGQQASTSVEQPA